MRNPNLSADEQRQVEQRLLDRLPVAQPAKAVARVKHPGYIERNHLWLTPMAAGALLLLVQFVILRRIGNSDLATLGFGFMPLLTKVGLTISALGIGLGVTRTDTVSAIVVARLGIYGAAIVLPVIAVLLVTS
jgi:hypothetical protein